MAYPYIDTLLKTVVEDDRIYGRGLVNMKAAFPCYIEAVSALQKTGIKLKGDLIIAGVVGEIEKAQVDRFNNYSATAHTYILPPGTTNERVAILRKAFMETITGAEFAAELKKAKPDLNPLDVTHTKC